MRDMIPGSSGESVTITSPGDTVIKSRNYSVDPSWNMLNLEFVVFVQSNSTREVLQGGKWKIPMDIPNLAYESSTVDDASGNGDGRADPTETVDLIVSLTNGIGFQNATSVTATLNTTDPEITITKNSCSYPTIPAGGSADNSLDPFTFSVDGFAEAHKADFTMDVSAQPNNYNTTINFTLMIGRPEVLLVIDDEGATYEDYYRDALNDLTVLYDEWDVVTDGFLGSELLYYVCVIWYTGDDATTTLTAQDQTDLTTFMDGGGSLILTGQNIGEDIGSDPFYINYLHALWDAPVASENVLEGVTGDPIGDGLDLLTQGGGGAGNQTSQDVITPIGGASPVINYTPTEVAAIRYDSGTYKMVYFAFGLEGLNPLSFYAGRDTVLARTLGWTGCGITVGVEEEEIGETTPNLAFNSLPNPFNNSTSFRFTIPAELETSLKIYDVSGQHVKTLMEGEQSAGSYNLSWDSRSDAGTRVPSGIYFAKLSVGSEEATHKLTLIR
jgi:hypothetical protein